MATPTILVPLDSSPSAESALPWAVHLARLSNASLRLVEVHSPPVVMMGGESLSSAVIPDDAIRDTETAYLAQVQSRLKNARVTVTAELLDGGVVSSLMDYASTLQPSWVVMLSHGRGAIARFFLGETAHEFVRKSTSPVLLVRESDEALDLLTPPFVTRILVPLDGSELAERMIGPATAFAKLVGADIELLMALDAVPDMEAISRRHEAGLPGPWDPAAAPAKAELYLHHQADRIRAQSIKARCIVVPHGKAADAIIAEADSKPGTVIALATHGRSGLSTMVWGSVASDVIRRAKGPVLVQRPLVEG